MKCELGMIVVGMALAGCSNPSPSAGSGTTPVAAEAEGTREIEVDAQMVDCTGVGPQKCLRIRKNPQAEWELWYSGIEGFTHKAGVKARLRIREEKVPNPPADGSSLRLILVEVLEQTPAKP
ncbi:DUF4377 domain-containing protein [Pendulispora rubella]|uniref:DUF4377 domain-containing protein n=1 Tax=Pendulispora rubella TaxID=2741070 RepID=A0ABZ2KR47_9BACT